MSGLLTTTPPATEPVTLAEAKAWLRVEGTEEDALIGALITAARQHIEGFTRRALVTTGYTLKLDAFPYDARNQSREIVLPRPPLASLTSIEYLDTNGALQTLNPTTYVVDTYAQPAKVFCRTETAWPATYTVPNAITLVYTAGYGTPAAIPAGLLIALRYIVAHWYELRTPVNVGNIVNEIPLTAQTLMWQERILDFN